MPVRVFRGRAPTIDADRTASERLLAVAAGGDPAVRIWIPHRQVAFGRRDRSREGYERAREAAREAGFQPAERDVGGRAVASDGETTVAFARADPVTDVRRGITHRYGRLTAAVERALSELGVATERGEPDGAFCPGTHSLSVRGSPRASDSGDASDGNDGDADTTDSRRKLVGIAQRVRRDAALTAGIVPVDGREELVGVLTAVYGALEVTLDSETVGTVADAGGPADPERVREVLERALVDTGTETGSETISASVDALFADR